MAYVARYSRNKTSLYSDGLNIYKKRDLQKPRFRFLCILKISFLSLI